MTANLYIGSVLILQLFLIETEVYFLKIFKFFKKKLPADYQKSKILKFKYF